MSRPEHSNGSHQPRNATPDERSRRQSQRTHRQQSAAGQSGADYHTGNGHSPEGKQTNYQPAGGAGSSATTGFRLVSVSFAGLGAALVLGGLLLLSSASTVATYAGPLGSAVAGVGVVLGALGVVHLAAGYGTWRFRSWGRTLGLVIAGGGLLSSVPLLVAGGPAGAVGLVVHGAIAWYLYTTGERYARLRRARA